MLWNAQPSGWLAVPVLVPLRDLILDPLFGFAIIVLPPLGHAFPRIDGILTALVRGNVWCMGWFYGNDNDDDSRLRSACNTTGVWSGPSSAQSKAVVKFARPPVSDWTSAVRGTMALALSVTAELVSVMFNRSQRTQQWYQTLAEFQSFLQASGVAEELEEAVAKPFWEGRLLDNVKILNDVQEVLYKERASQFASIADTKEALLEGKRCVDGRKYLYLCLDLTSDCPWILSHHIWPLLSLTE